MREGGGGGQRKGERGGGDSYSISSWTTLAGSSRSVQLAVVSSVRHTEVGREGQTGERVVGGGGGGGG